MSRLCVANSRSQNADATPITSAYNDSYNIHHLKSISERTDTTRSQFLPPRAAPCSEYSCTARRGRRASRPKCVGGDVRVTEASHAAQIRGGSSAMPCHARLGHERTAVYESVSGPLGSPRCG